MTSRAPRERPLPDGGQLLGLRPVAARGAPRARRHRHRIPVHLRSRSCATPRIDPSGLIAGLIGYATRGREHARHRLLGRRLRLLRAGPADRRLRRHRDRRRPAVGATARWAWPGFPIRGSPSSSSPRPDPPSLAAITPLSVIADTARSCSRRGASSTTASGWPGLEHVLDGADPYGKGWEQALVDAGDTVCEENQLLHGQKVDVIAKALEQRVLRSCGRGPAGPVHLRRQDRHSGVPDRGLAGRADRPPLRDDARQVHGAPAQALHHVQRRAPGRLCPAGPDRVDDLPRLLRSQRRSPDRPDAAHPGPDLVPGASSARSSTCRRPGLRVTADFTEALADYRGRAAGTHHLRERAHPERLGCPAGELRDELRRLARRGTTARRLYFQPDGTLGDEPPAESESASTLPARPRRGGAHR